MYVRRGVRVPLEVRLTVEKKKNVRQLKLALLWWTTMMAGQSGLSFSIICFILPRN